MATYVNNLRLKEIVTGAESGTWGTSTNTNLELIADAFGSGTEAITTNADTHTTTVADGAADEGRAIYMKYTGTLDSACTITLAPNTINKFWIIENATSGSQNIIISQGSGANITIGNGNVAAIFTDGAGSGAAVLDALADLELSAKLIVAGNVDFNGDLDVDGTTNLDAVDIDGAVQVDSTITVGVDDTGYDVKFFGDTASAYMLWDTSTDDLVLAGAAGIDLAGDIDVDGTANLDIVDIDGAVDMASTLTLAGNADFNGDLDVDGTSNLDVVDIDGAVDMASTLGVTGASTLTGAVTAVAGITMTGTTPTLTIGDAGAEDTKIVFDGNAQDYYVGLDDSNDTFTIGLGSAVGSTPAIMINSSSQFAFNNDNHTSDYCFSGSDDAITMNVGSPLAATNDWSGIALGSVTSPKGAIFFKRTATYNRGDVIICTNAEANTNKPSLADDDDLVAKFSSDKVSTFFGDCGVLGAFSKGSGSFKIDHPLPAKKDTHHLVHSFVEGPKADLIYRGTADLSSGVAQVDLDEAAGMTEGTWELLCRNPQVWTQNDSGWSGVRGSVEGNILTIECKDSVSDDTVSWMVVAERCDAHIMETGWTDDEGRVIVEPLKPTDDG
jgi:hypothetical protein